MTTTRRSMTAPKLLAVLVASIVPAACGDDAGDESATQPDTETVRLWIEPQMVDCEGGAGPQQCLQISRSEGGELELFYDQIEGFTFEEGTSYVIDVTVEEVAEPAADASSLRYTLVEVVEP